MIIIEKITIRQDVEVRDEKARVNLKNLLARVLDVNLINVEMRFEDKNGEPKPFKEGL